MKTIAVTLTDDDVRLLTRARLAQKVKAVPPQTSFTLPELIGSKWGAEFLPFFNLYNNTKTAGIEMGKLLGIVAREFGCTQAKDTKYGRKQISRWTKP